MLGALMTEEPERNGERAALLDAVALLSNLPEHGLASGQVGTVVESLDDKTLLVEFSDDEGHAYAIVPCQRADLLVLHYEKQSA